MTTRSTPPATASDSTPASAPALKDWEYSAPLDETKIAVGAVAGAAVFAVGLSQIFNPLALGVAAAYGVGKVLHSQVTMNVRPLRERAFAKSIAKGSLTPVEADQPVMQMTADISRQLGHAEPPKVYYIDDKTVAKLALPPGLRWLMKLEPTRKAIAQSVMPKIFAALPGGNTLVTTREALRDGLNADELRYIAAHEMAHLHKDNFSPAINVRAVITHTSRALLLACGVGLGLAAFGVTLPLTAAVGSSLLLATGGLMAVTMAAKAANNFGLRTAEIRADRNALHTTRDLKNAMSALDALHGKPFYRAKRTPMALEIFSTHPTHRRRIDKLCEVFNDVAQHKPLPPVNDNKPAEKHKIAL